MSAKPYHLDVAQPDNDKTRIDVGGNGSVLVSNGTASAPSFKNYNTFGCLVGRDNATGNLTVPDATWTAATLTTVEEGTHNVDGNWSDNIYTCPATGLYSFFYMCRFRILGVVTGDTAQVRFLLSSGDDMGTYTVGMLTGIQNSFFSCVRNVSLTAGETVQPQIRQFSGTNIDALANAEGSGFRLMWYFSAEYHGPTS